MSRDRILSICLLLGAAWLATGVGPASGQPAALPATVLPGEQVVLPSGPVIIDQPETGGFPNEAVADETVPVVELPDTDMPLPPPTAWAGPWTWQVLPNGILYKSYLAGGREPRMASQLVHERDLGWLWDVTLGARVGILRFGTPDAIWPEGWQLDVEGAAFPRLDLEHERDLVSVDCRGGIPLTVRQGPWEGKFGYYHLSSHLGDEFMLRVSDFSRINYSRDCLVLGLALRPEPDWRLYGETAWAFSTDGGSRPWEFQVGIEYSPAQPSGFRGTPFLALNGHLRQEVNYGGSFSAQAGWQWRGLSGQLTRLGAHYFNGKSEQYQFFRFHEEQIGIGLWYDF